MKFAKIAKILLSVSLLSAICIPNQIFADTTKIQVKPAAESTSFDVQISGEEGKKLWKISDITITADAPEKTETSIQIDDGAITPFSNSYSYSDEGKHTATVYLKDEEGKELGQVSKKIKIDKTKPELKVQTTGLEGENGWLRSDVEVSVGAEDLISKLARVDFGFDTRELETYIEPFWVREEGTHYIAAEAEDNAGNVEKLEHPFYIDKTKPVISNVYLQREYFWGQEFPIRFQTFDAISGVSSITATINGKNVTNGSNYLFTEPGWHTYRIEVKDTAGWAAVYETRFEVYIPARITFHPDSLQLDHGSGMATNFIELPAPFEPERINFSTVQTNSQIVHVQDPQYGYVKNPIGDEDENGIRDMMLKYERETLVPVIVPYGNGDDKWSPTVITMYGEWGDYHFKGYDDFRVLNSGYVPPPPDVTPPGISMEPPDNSTNVSVNVTPILTFTEPVLSSGGTELSDEAVEEIIRFTNQQGEEIPFTANWMKNTPSIQVNPNVQLVGDTTYTIEFAGQSVMDAAYNPYLSVTEAVYNQNNEFRSNFTTESYSIVFLPPLPIPVIEIEVIDEEPPPLPPPTKPKDDPPTVSVKPRVLPLPDLPPSLLNEWQVYLNNTVAREISMSSDQNVISNGVNRAIETLEAYLSAGNETSTLSASRLKKKKESAGESSLNKFDVLDHTVNSVMKEVTTKLENGEISPEQAAQYTSHLLHAGYGTLIEKLPDDSSDEFDQTIDSFNALLDQVVSKIQVFEIPEGLANELDNSIHGLIAKQNNYEVANKASISDLAQKVKETKKNLKSLQDKLSHEVSAINVPYILPVYLNDKEDTQVTIQPKAVKSMIEANFSLSIENGQKAGIIIPAEWLDETGAKKLQISLKKSKDSKKKNNEKNEQAYQYEVKVNGKSVTEVEDQVIIKLPVSSSNESDLKVYYFDEETEEWTVVTDENGEAITVNQTHDYVSFSSKHIGLFKISE